MCAAQKIIVEISVLLLEEFSDSMAHLLAAACKIYIYAYQGPGLMLFPHSLLTCDLMMIAVVLATALYFVIISHTL